MYKRNVLVLNWSFFSNYVYDVSKELIFSDLCNAIYTFIFSPRCFKYAFFYLDQVHFDSLNIIIIIVYIFYHIGYIFFREACLSILY